ncbi:hypothetical protein Dimus_005753 [Dionaea muscipula]
MIITAYIIRCKRAGVKPLIPVFYKLFKLIDNRNVHHISTGYFIFALWKPEYAVVERKSNVKFWKVKYLFVTTLASEIASRLKTVLLSPRMLIKDRLDPSEESIRAMFSSKTEIVPH